MNINGQSVQVDMRMMKRKSMRLALTDEGVVDLRVPMGCSQLEVARFLDKHESWLVQRLTQLQENKLSRLNEFQHLGRYLPLVRLSGLKAVEVAEDLVRIPDDWNDEQILAALENWRRRFAQEEFGRQIDEWWPLFSRFARSRPVLRVKKMRTRWGSLSARGYINLNLALTQMPPELIELVVVHELCHLKHMDHGKGFQALMTQALPDWRIREQQLKALAKNMV